MTVKTHAPKASCRVCRAPLASSRLDLGHQPLCNRFLGDPGEEEYRHPLSAAICPACALLQLVAPPPAREITPRFSWIRYNEPEGHLDHLTRTLLALAPRKERLVVAGVSYKDDSTLERFQKAGADAVWRITPEELGLDGAGAEIETVQDRLTPLRGAAIAGAHPAADILLVRHILEHSHDPAGFLGAVRTLVEPDGLVAFEVPDSTDFLTLLDYSPLWEEHVLYFTPATLKQCLALHGFELVHLENYPYALENSLVAVARPREPRSASAVTAQERDREVARAQQYFGSFAGERDHYRRALAEYRRGGGEIALLGAGHHACMFLNLMDLAQHVSCVLDDDRNRQGLFMPGSRLPIRPGTLLAEGAIGLCLLSLNPANEEKVIARQHDFADAGGVFKSIYPSSRHAIRS